MSRRPAEKWISRRLIGLLRYHHKGFDAEGFAPLGAVVWQSQCRWLQRYDTEFITRAIENSKDERDDAPRFVVRRERGILFVKVRHQEPSRVRETTWSKLGRAWKEPWGEPWGGEAWNPDWQEEWKEACQDSQSDSYLDSEDSSNAECDAHDCRASALGCRSQLLSFLIQVFAWLSPQEHVPSTACLQTFVESNGWKTFVPLGPPPRERCSSADLDRSWCLQLIEWQIFRLNAAGLVENQLHADARRNSCTVQDYLRDLWQLNRYDSSWQMSWQHLLHLFTELLARP